MKRYRQSEHLVPLGVWSGLCLCAAVFLVSRAPYVEGPGRVACLLGALALLLFGPAALAVAIVRASLFWVAVDRERGIVLNGRAVVPWEEIVRVERRPSLLERFSKSNVSMKGCLGLGVLTVAMLNRKTVRYSFTPFLVCLAIGVGWFVLVFFLLPFLLIPVLEVFGPFAEKIVVVTRSGRVVLGDLRESEEFVTSVRSRVPVGRLSER